MYVGEESHRGIVPMNPSNKNRPDLSLGLKLERGVKRIGLEKPRVAHTSYSNVCDPSIKSWALYRDRRRDGADRVRPRLGWGSDEVSVG
jgi:hypothetical protein